MIQRTASSNYRFLTLTTTATAIFPRWPFSPSIRSRINIWWRRFYVPAVGILSRLISRLRKAFPKARIRVRLDGGFAAPEVLDFLDCEPKVEYLVNLAANAVLKRKAEAAMKRARRESKISGQTEHVYGECRYATHKTWPWKRRVI